jgi:hypothetical protein
MVLGWKKREEDKTKEQSSDICGCRSPDVDAAASRESDVECQLRLPVTYKGVGGAESTLPGGGTPGVINRISAAADHTGIF